MMYNTGLTYSQQKMWNILGDNKGIIPWNGIREEMIADSLQHYFELGLPPGGLLTAILANDWSRAERCQHPIFRMENFVEVIADWIQENFPGCCYGSYDKVDRWIKFNGIEGYEKMMGMTDDE